MNQDFLDWLASDTAIGCVLVETSYQSAGQEVMLYLSDRGYRTGATDTPENTEYLDLLRGDVKITEQVSVDGNASMSYGGVDLDNTEGDLDYLLDGVWVNRDIRVYYGDVRWPRSSFQLVFSGVVGDIEARATDTLTISLADKLKRLDTPITETKLGGTTDNREQIIPVAVGECFNVSPLLVDPGAHKYQWNIRSAERLIEVRDESLPVNATPTLSAGTFVLNQQPKGTITCSVQGDNSGGYSNTIVGCIKKLAKDYGKVGYRFTDADLDLTALTQFDTDHPQSVGYYVTDNESVLSVCQEIASSVGAMVLMNRQGLLRVLQIALPPVGSPVMSFTQDDMVERTLRPVSRTEVAAAVKLGYCRNWTIHDNRDTGLPEAHRDLFKLEYIPINRGDSAVATQYRLHTTPDMEKTVLNAEGDATAEADRRLAMRKVPHTVYEFTGYAPCFQLQLGNVVNIKHPRFGLSAGKNAVVVNLQPNWKSKRCIVQVII